MLFRSQGDKPVSTVTVDEAMQLCVAFRDYLRANLSRELQDDVFCTARALGTTTNPADCEAMRAACLAAPTGVEYVDEAFDCSGAGPIAGCDATVDSVEACYEADVQLTADRLDRIDCAIAGDLPALEALQAPLPVPAACTSAGAMACPTLEDGLFER